MFDLARIVVLVAVAVVAGCYHARVVAASDAKDFGETVQTRFRYRLICEDNDDKDVWMTHKFAGMTMCQRLQACQPTVFADDGIPVVLSFADLLNDEAGDWTVALTYFSCGVFPALWLSHLHRRCDVSSAGQHLASVEICVRKGSSGAPTPLPVLMFSWDDTPCFPSSRVFKLHDYKCCQMSYIYQDVATIAMAYGIAARLKEAEDSGKIDERFASLATSAQSLSDVAITQAKIQADRMTRHGAFALPVETGAVQSFEIVRCDNEKQKDFAYEFTLKKRDGGAVSLADYGAMRTAFRSAIRSHYVSLHPKINPRTLVIDFTDYALKEDVVTGRVAVLTISPESITYDAASRRGIISIRIGDGQFDDARRWIRRNLSSLANRNNIAANGDTVPQGALFYSESEEMRDGILNVSFKTE